ncbi:DNA polymerase III subunit alpha [Dyadobacter sp. CY107]|uniref:DNA polymerase III subunit alpha n=1 Tax=Dyadobacter fanqingshengii TaxID=2906443 RepID=UPI001F17B384|nr:DNA polymerase III subunit alpha [Dyadobacter fanqingshengii]MCF2506836.1 DNA polymerase III subunit alpha [Dyadobacter fanqingshengii]
MLINCHSYFSLRYGTLSTEDLTNMLAQNEYDVAVLTDINNSSGVFPFVQSCRDKGITPIVGMEYRTGDRLLYIGIAKNEAGFGELNQLVSTANLSKAPLPDFPPSFNNAFVVYPYGSRPINRLRENEYIGVKPSDLPQIVMEPRSNYDRYVILWPVTVKGPKDFVLHQQLRAVDHNTIFSKLTTEMYAKLDDVMPSRAKLINTYQMYPEIIQGTEKLLAQCSFNFDFEIVRNKKFFTGNGHDDRILLERYTMTGLERRYGKKNKEALGRVQKELRIIDDLNFSSYFLITHDIVRYAASRDFQYVGRGSGANSIVAYCLGITDVCPIELDLYFERFLNPKRKTPPDFDVDFSWRDRDEIFEYIFNRYQTKHTALMGAMSTFKDRSVIRELGKVYGLPKEDIDLLIKNPGMAQNYPDVVEKIIEAYEQLADYPNQRTIHACGVLISEDPITNYTALDLPPKGFPTAHIDMHVAEQIHFEKFDILSQRGLGHIKDCIQIIKDNRGEAVDISNPKKLFFDPKIQKELREANTLGCFYIESPAMRQLLTKLRCDTYLVLVAASSVIRPGVASSGMMKAYIERHRDPAITEYLHPIMEQQLKETYGVMVYQEDVIKIGHYFGGLDLADADVLRRMMSGKTRSAKHMAEIRDKYFNHCQQVGHPEDVAKEVWRQMESFAGYSFSKAHSASFAVESFQSLYLKAYYPIEFMVSVVNNYGGFYDRRTYLHEATKAGAIVHVPCVNKSFMQTTLEGIDIYLGFDYMKDLESHTVETLLSVRETQGKFISLEDFVLRTGISIQQVKILIRAGAFSFTGKVKTNLMWEAHWVCPSVERSTPPQLFGTQVTFPKLPVFEYSLVEHLYDEIEILSVPVSGTYFDFLKTDFRGDVMAADLGKYVGKVVRMVGEYVNYKPVKTKQGQIMMFFTFLDVNKNFFDTVHFPDSLANWKFQGAGVYLVEGTVTEEFECYSLTVKRFAKIPIKQNPKNITTNEKELLNLRPRATQQIANDSK